MIVADKENFEKKLDKLGDLYEEAKLLIDSVALPEILSTPDKSTADIGRLYEVVREMRDLAAVCMQANHFKSEN